MSRLLCRLVLICVVLGNVAAIALAQQPRYTTWRASGKNGAVAAGGREAAEAGVTILKAGGNAVDAAVGTVLALSVTDANSFCFGGEVPFLIYNPNRKTVEVLAGIGVAPRLATREYFVKRGRIPVKGIEPAAVPAVVDACTTALVRHGTMTFTQVAAPMLAILDRDGVKEDGRWKADLAVTMRRLCEAEQASSDDRIRGLQLVSDYFYRGPLAHEFDEWMRANGGLIRYTDMATHVTRIDQPVTANYHGYTVYKPGFWTQGPYLLQSLQMLDPYDIKQMGRNKADTIHTMVESLKLALADRDIYYADPLFADVPGKELLSREYTDMRRKLIDNTHASLTQVAGDPRNGKPILENAHFPIGPGGPNLDTTTCVVADSAGFVVAATPSGFSGEIAGRTGVRFGTRLQQLNTHADSPNCIEPGKRPRITLTPSLIFKDDKPVFAISVAGGDAQDQAALQLLVNAIDFGMKPEEAASAPRFLTDHFINSFGQEAPKLGSLALSQTLEPAVIEDLKSRGHKVTVHNGVAGSNPVMLFIDHEKGEIHAAGDPKARRNAFAY